MKHTIAIVALLALGAVAFPTPASWKMFQAKYKISAESNIYKGKCQNCHVSMKGGKLNGYGKDIQVVMKAAGTKKFNTEFLTKVEALDSTKSGQTNIAKINADKVVGQ